MKIYILHLLTTVCVMLTLVACNPAQSKIDDLQVLVTEVEAEYSEYTAEDWNGVTEAYEAILLDMQQYEYTVEQRKQIGRLKGKFEGLAMKFTLKNLPDAIEGAAGELMESVGGFLDEMSSEAEESTDETI